MSGDWWEHSLPRVPTLVEAEDAAANALARLLFEGMEARVPTDLIRPGGTPWREYRGPGRVALIDVCRELLRGTLEELDDPNGRRPGGYCMRRPTDPRLVLMGTLGARLVELSYVRADRPVEAWDEAMHLIMKAIAKAGVGPYGAHASDAARAAQDARAEAPDV
jgi:hypothetical protein